MESNASELMSNIFERKREIEEISGRVDPFFLIKECAEMSKYKPGDVDQNRSNFNNFVGYDPKSIEEKMKNFKFAKVENVQKDTNWFKKMEDVKIVQEEPKPMKIGLSDSDEK